MGNLNAHLAYLFAQPAVNTAIFVKGQSIQTESVEESVKSSKGAQIFAEGTIGQDRKNHNDHQYGKFPLKQETDCLPQTFVGQQERDSCAQCTGRAYVFAEPGGSHPVLIPKQGRQQEHKQNKYHIFYITEPAVQFCRNRDLSAGDPVQKMVGNPLRFLSMIL